MQAGDKLVSHDGQLIEITSINSTDEITTVYNLRVADLHTYFVGGEEFQSIEKQYGLDLNESWNKMLLPHRGRHTHSYHDFVLQGMQDAHQKARGNKDLFLTEYRAIVIDQVVANPKILYL